MRTLLTAALLFFFLQAPKANLEGVVTKPDGKQPVAGARVTLRRTGAPRDPSAAALPVITTNAQGQFAFQGLDEGAYVVAAVADGHVPSAGLQVRMTAGQTTRDLLLRLTPAATISGRIRDPQGIPLVDVPVHLFRSSYDFQGNRSYQPAGAVRTNDRGEYRIYWVTPGRYYLLAGDLTSTSDAMAATARHIFGTESPSGTRVAPVRGYAFYPGVPEFALSRTLDLQPGAELPGIDLVVTPNPPAFRISGRLIDSSTGRPPATATVGLIRNPAMDFDGIAEMMEDIVPNRNYNPATGVFTVEDVSPGAYFVKATVSDPGTRQTRATGTLAVAVSAKDVEGLTLTAVPSVTIRGRLRIEGQLPAGMPANCVRLNLVPLQSSDAPLPELRSDFAQCKQLAPDGTFELANVPPGNYGIAVYGFPVGIAGPEGRPANYQATLSGQGFIKEALFQGADVLNNPLRLVSDRAEGTLDITISMGGGRLDGTLTDNALKPLASRRVVLVPERGRFQWQLFRTATTNENGQFSMPALAPGGYKLFAWESMEENAWFDADILARYDSDGRTVRITETSADAVDLRIIPAEGAR